MAGPSLRVLELFAGIGGLSAAIGSDQVVAAIDISTDAAQVYRANFQAPYYCREIDSLTNAEFGGWQANLWWFSAPCQPYSCRGRQQDHLDRRAFAIERVLDALKVAEPAMIGLENVPGFARSQSHRRLLKWLASSGYHWQSIELCPTLLGWPNRRPRYFLIASKRALPDWRPLPNLNQPLESLIMAIDYSTATEHLWLKPSEMRFADGFDRIRLYHSPCSACFTASYGKTLIRSGSYLETDHGLRRFSPREVARLLGFPESFQLPRLAAEPFQADRKLWKLLGNSLSIPCVRYVIDHLEISIA